MKIVVTSLRWHNYMIHVTNSQWFQCINQCRKEIGLHLSGVSIIWIKKLLEQRNLSLARKNYLFIAEYLNPLIDFESMVLIMLSNSKGVMNMHGWLHGCGKSPVFKLTVIAIGFEEAIQHWNQFQTTDKPWVTPKFATMYSEWLPSNI